MNQAPKEQRSEFYGKVSQLYPVPLFDRKSDMTHSFAKELYDRRKKEIDECAAKSGFVKLSHTVGTVSFVKKTMPL